MSMGAVGAGVSVASALFQGMANEQSASYQAAVARNNAIIAQQNEEYAASAGAVNAENIGLQGAQRLGGIKAGQAASGIDVNTGSAAAVQKSQAEVNQYSELTAENEGLYQAYGYAAQATSYQAQAGLEQMQAENAIPAAILSAAGGAISSYPILNMQYNAMGPGASGGGTVGVPINQYLVNDEWGQWGP
jgi:hypothetical protein